MILFDKIIFGPVRSRRLGLSLGVNLLPVDAKICTFNCVYCECGFNTTMKENPLPSREDVRMTLEAKLLEMSVAGEIPDVITFAGNGEPSIHPQFEEIIQDTIELRNQLCPNTKVSVLSNSTQIHKDSVFNALLKVDQNILKFDTALDKTLGLLDQPVSSKFNVAWQIAQLKKFNGNLIIQTMFLRGSVKGEEFDNTTDEELDAWLAAMKEINPSQIMIYSLDREAPVKSLVKIQTEELKVIAGRIEQEGFRVFYY